MNITTIMSLCLASFFVIITTLASIFMNRIFKVRLAHEEKVYAQREVLIDLLTKKDKEVVDETVSEWLADHLNRVREDTREELERVYGDTLRSIINEAQGGSHVRPVQPE